MWLYTPDLATLAQVRAHRRFQQTETADDALLTQFIHEASAELIQKLGRVPMPWIQTRLIDYTDETVREDERELRVDEDLLSVTTLTNGDGVAISGSNYRLLPHNRYPKRLIKLKPDYVFTYDEDPDGAISVAGEWGYVPHYSIAWVTSAFTSPTINSSVTSISVTAHTFQVLQYIKIGSEVMQVTATSTNAITVTRGELGTTAAAHTSGDAIAYYRQIPDIVSAVTEIAVYKYKHKDSLGARVTVYDGGVVTSEDLAKSVGETIERHRVRWTEYI